MNVKRSETVTQDPETGAYYIETENHTALIPEEVFLAVSRYAETVKSEPTINQTLLEAMERG